MANSNGKGAAASATGAAPATALYVVTATGAVLAAKAGQATRQAVTVATTSATGATVWQPTAGKGTGRAKAGQPAPAKHAAPNTRAAVMAALASLPQPFTAAQAAAALAPLQASGALGSGSTAAGYWAWVLRVGHAATAPAKPAK
jgi:hypothetical protein